jgi:hypothetical protein
VTKKKITKGLPEGGESGSLVKGFGNHADLFKQGMAVRIADEFTDYLNDFHTRNIQNDDGILTKLYSAYIIQLTELKKTKPHLKVKGKRTFRGSSSGSCPREHYFRLKGAKRDIPRSELRVLPQTTRWQNIGTRIGDMIQFDVLLAEKYMSKELEKVPFKFDRIVKEIDGKSHTFPYFEEFSSNLTNITHNGKSFILTGSTDGVLIYTDSNGETLRVGLECKSKQTSYSRTSLFSMKEADPKHVSQCVTYSMKFDVDFWIILYVNASKKSWQPTEEEVRKNPDIRAFGVYITDDMKKEVLDKFADVCEAIDSNTPPKLSLDGWNFNEYKTACALSLTEKELEELEREVDEIEELPFNKFKIKMGRQAIEEIKVIRSGGEKSC